MSDEKKKILIADDDVNICEVTKIMLNNFGNYSVETTNSGSTLYNLDYKPDLILLDLWMNEIDGEDVCSYLKSQEETKGIPILVFSASRELKAKATAAGADDYIPKPFSMESLLEKVKRLTSEKEEEKLSA